MILSKSSPFLLLAPSAFSGKGTCHGKCVQCEKTPRRFHSCSFELPQTDHPCLGAGLPQLRTIPSSFVMPSAAHTPAEIQGRGLYSMMCSHDLSPNKISRDLVIALVLGVQGGVQCLELPGIKCMRAKRASACSLQTFTFIQIQTTFSSVHH